MESVNEPSLSRIPRGPRPYRIVWTFARIWVGLIFFYAGLSKLLEPVENFRGVIAQYQVIPYERVGAIALILPWIELVFGTFLILGYWETVSAAVLGTVTLGFLLILGSSNVLLEGGGDCGCFGANSPIHLSPRQVFAMDFLNFLICIKLYLRKRTPWSLDTFFRRAR